MAALSGRLLFALTLILASGVQAEVNGSFVWCEPKDPLPFCIDTSANPYKANIQTAGRAWTTGTSWNLNEVQNCRDARIVVKAKRRGVMEMLTEQTHAGQFQPTESLTEDVFGLLKPCVWKAEVVIWIDGTANRVNTALHEFGHALKLGDTGKKTDVMYHTKQVLAALSPKDIEFANSSFNHTNLEQFHRIIEESLVGPDAALAYADIGVEVLAPGLPVSTAVGLLPLTRESFPGEAAIPEGFNQVFAAAFVGPEWAEGEVEPGVPFAPKWVELEGGVQVSFDLAGADLLSFRGIRGEHASESSPGENLAVAQWDAAAGLLVPLETAAEEANPLRLTATAGSFGYFGVIGLADAVEDKEERPVFWKLVGSVALLLALIFLAMKAIRSRAAD